MWGDGEGNSMSERPTSQILAERKAPLEAQSPAALPLIFRISLTLMGPEFFICMSFSTSFFYFLSIYTRKSWSTVSQLSWESASVICRQSGVSCTVTMSLFLPLAYSLLPRTSCASCIKLCCLSQKSSLFFS